MERQLVAFGLFFVVVATTISDAAVQAFSSLAPYPRRTTRTSAPSRHRSSSSSLSTELFSIPDPIDTLTSGLASICRLPRGVTVRTGYSSSDVVTIKRLYDVENSRGCRKVRELLTELDLVVDSVIPACRNSRVFTDASYEYALPKDALIPRMVLVEKNSVDGAEQEMTLSGADEILDFLETKYSLANGDAGAAFTNEALAVLQELGNYVASLLRLGRGSKVSPAALMMGGDDAVRPPEKPLVLYSYEGNQFCRLVREVLTELDLVYELRSAGKGSPRRAELADVAPGGSTQCPFLLDPNQDRAMAESADIVRYLYQNYARWTPPSELLQWTSDYVMSLAKPVFAIETPLQAGSYKMKQNDEAGNENEIAKAQADIQATIQANPVVVYTYKLSPFSSETLSLLSNLEVEYKEISLGQEWIPGLMNEGGAATRAALLEMTGQSSLPHIFIGGQSIGGLYSGTPGLLPLLQQGKFTDMVQSATAASSKKGLSSFASR